MKSRAVQASTSPINAAWCSSYAMTTHRPPRLAVTPRTERFDAHRTPDTHPTTLDAVADGIHEAIKVLRSRRPALG